MNYLFEDYEEHEYLGYKIRFWVQEGRPGSFMHYFCGIVLKTSKSITKVKAK